MGENPEFAILGSGNLATNMAMALHKAGLHISLIYSKEAEHAQRLAALVDCKWTTQPEEVSQEETDIVLSALKDDIAPDIWRQIDFRDRLLLHTAGSLPMSVLDSHSRNHGVIYPLMTLSKNRILDFSNLPLLIEANSSQNLQRIKDLASRLSHKVYVASSETRGKAHLAAVFANNFSNHMYAKASELLHDSGLPFEVLLPLIDETANKVHQLTPAEAQTGPAIRYDENIMAKHKAMLSPDDAALYQAISLSIHQMMQQNNQ